MGDRKDDVRIYIIFFFFFVCSTTGGILLCLYIFLPSAHNAESWFAILGLLLVAIPWFVWFLIYLYRCFKPTVIDNAGGEFRDRNSRENSNSNSNNNNKPSSGGLPKSSAAPSDAVPRPSISSYESVTTHSQNNGGGGGLPPDGDGGSGGERHVHFGAVVVVENGSSRGSNNSISHSQRQNYKAAVDGCEEFSGELECKEQEDTMSESERPLTSITRS